jgi:predicted Fe-Mo cluster-binding NifX family protein
MKLCIPTSDEKGYEAEAHDHLGSAPWFTFIDLDSNEIKVVANPDCHHRPGSCHHVPLLLAHHTDVVACKTVGHRSFEALNEAGIGVLAPVSGTVARIVDAVRAGEVNRLTADKARRGGLHRHRDDAGHERGGRHTGTEPGGHGRRQGGRREQRRGRPGGPGGGGRQRRGGPGQPAAGRPRRDR